MPPILRSLHGCNTGMPPLSASLASFRNEFSHSREYWQREAKSYAYKQAAQLPSTSTNVSWMLHISDQIRVRMILRNKASTCKALSLNSLMVHWFRSRQWDAWPSWCMKLKSALKKELPEPCKAPLVTRPSWAQCLPAHISRQPKPRLYYANGPYNMTESPQYELMNIAESHIKYFTGARHTDFHYWHSYHVSNQTRSQLKMI